MLFCKGVLLSQGYYKDIECLVELWEGVVKGRSERGFLIYIVNVVYCCGLGQFQVQSIMGDLESVELFMQSCQKIEVGIFEFWWLQSVVFGGL